jgi:cobalt-zinc-cadmium efflux system outer membrane protein
MQNQALALAFVAACLAAPAGARDLSLAEAETQLLARNRELVAARRSVESADAGIEIAQARPNAVLSFNTTSISTSPGIGSGSLTQKRVDSVLRIDQPFERGEKRELRIDAAQGLHRAAQADVLDVARQQLGAVRSAYYELKQAQEKRLVLGETGELFARTLQAAQARLKAGDLAPADVARVQVDHERAQIDARSAQAELARAQIVLGFMIGEDGGAAGLKAVDPWPQAVRVDPQAVAAAVAARPDVLAATARVEAAEKLRDLARAQRSRDVTVGAQVERYPGTMPANSIGFGVAIPLFTGNDYSGDIRKAEVDRYAALDNLARVRAVAENDVRRAASDLNAAVERLERHEGTLLAAARRSADAAEFAFQRGASSVLEVLDARRTLRAVQLDGLAARVEHAKALAAWRASYASPQVPEQR